MAAGIDKCVEPCTKLLVSSAFCKSTHFAGDLHEEQLRRVCVVNISCVYSYVGLALAGRSRAILSALGCS